jgi:hypothetical protein
MEPVVGYALRGGLALLLASAALAKLRAPRDFTAAVAGYRLLPPVLVAPASAGFVGAELALAAALWIPAAHVAAAIASALLFALYALAIGLNLARGRRDIDCGCGGPLGRQTLSEGLVVRNALLACAALAAALPVAPRALGWLDLVTLAASVAAAALLYTAAGALCPGSQRSALLGARPRPT